MSVALYGRLLLRGLAIAAALIFASLAGPPFGLAPIHVAHADDDDDRDTPSADPGSGASGGSSTDSGGDRGRRSIHSTPTYDATSDIRSWLRRMRGDSPAPARAPRPAPPTRSTSEAREVVVTGLGDPEIDRVVADGFTVIDRRALLTLPGATLRLRIPPRLSVAAASARVRAIAPAALVDRNHLYRGQNQPCAGGACAIQQLMRWPDHPGCRPRSVLGLIDTGIDTQIPALAGATITQTSSRGQGREPASRQHGSAIALLLVANSAELRGIVPDAHLLVVDAFHRRRDGDAADSFDLVAAIDRLAGIAPVINMSLSGPPNALVDRAGRVARERGSLIVAAAGNEGPRAAPRYPAAHPWAIAVTAIDHNDRVYARAGQGQHIAFAAPGVALRLPVAAQRFQVQSGTSLAAPLVAAAILTVRDGQLDAPFDAVVDALARHARDLGDPGRDRIYGWGAVRMTTLCGGAT